MVCWLTGHAFLCRLLLAMTEPAGAVFWDEAAVEVQAVVWKRRDRGEFVGHRRVIRRDPSADWLNALGPDRPRIDSPRVCECGFGTP